MPKLTNQQCIDGEKEIMARLAATLPVKDCRAMNRASSWRRRIKELLIYRHWTHKCGMARPFAGKHEGVHQCGRTCDFFWLNR